jgi:hypothetical protein
MQNHLGIASRHELMSKRLQFTPQLDEVEDFTVESNPVPVSIRHRLMTGRRQIQDRQSSIPKKNIEALRTL